ncbi:MAG: hypothetical protein KGH75_03150 [Rhodospirillales bacterium]|nr:hypothetical protein [Rhodospirillales bacterium]
MSLKDKIAWLVESKEPVSRVDHPNRSKVVKDFSKDQNTYVRSPDWLSSGNQKILPKPNYKKAKGTFGLSNVWNNLGYVAPRHVPWFHYFDTKKKRHYIAFNKHHEDEIRNARPVQSVWTGGKQSKFKSLPSGEEFSKNPGKPSYQKVIHDPIKHMEDTGYRVKLVNDLEKHRNKVKKNPDIKLGSQEGMN